MIFQISKCQSWPVTIIIGQQRQRKRKRQRKTNPLVSWHDRSYFGPWTPPWIIMWWWRRSECGSIGPRSYCVGDLSNLKITRAGPWTSLEAHHGSNLTLMSRSWLSISSLDSFSLDHRLSVALQVKKKRGSCFGVHWNINEELTGYWTWGEYYCYCYCYCYCYWQDIILHRSGTLPSVSEWLAGTRALRAGDSQLGPFATSSTSSPTPLSSPSSSTSSTSSSWSYILILILACIYYYTAPFW